MGRKERPRGLLGLGVTVTEESKGSGVMVVSQLIWGVLSIVEKLREEDA